MIIVQNQTNFSIENETIVKEVPLPEIGSNYFRILISKIYDFLPKLSQGGTKRWKKVSGIEAERTG